MAFGNDKVPNNLYFSINVSLVLLLINPGNSICILPTGTAAYLSDKDLVLILILYLYLEK